MGTPKARGTAIGGGGATATVATRTGITGTSPRVTSCARRVGPTLIAKEGTGTAEGAARGVEGTGTPTKGEAFPGLAAITST